MVAPALVTIGVEGVEAQRRIVKDVYEAAWGRVRGASVNYRLQVSQAVNVEMVAAARSLGVPVEQLARACFQVGLGLFATASADLLAGAHGTVRTLPGFFTDWVGED
jgi:hypothetical protein